MQPLQRAVSELRSRGYRITKSRRHVLQTLLSSHQGLNRQEIVRQLAGKGHKVDLVSVYRTLLWLEEEGLAHRLTDSNAYVACRTEAKQCHHPVVCTECGKVDEVPCDGLESMVAGAMKSNRFHVQGHVLELRGLCDDCASHAA